jgi:hypothetical protein
MTKFLEQFYFFLQFAVDVSDRMFHACSEALTSYIQISICNKIKLNNVATIQPQVITVLTIFPNTEYHTRDDVQSSHFYMLYIYIYRTVI